MRMYAHDYVWGVQDRRAHPAPGFGLIDAALWLWLWLHLRLRRAAASRSRRAVFRPGDPLETRQPPTKNRDRFKSS